MTAWQETSLGEACELYQPKTISSADLIEDGEFLVYGANGVIGRYDQYNHENEEILITCRGATCGTVNISKPKSWINGNAMVVKPRGNQLDFGFLQHLLRGGIDLSIAITGAAQPQITRQSLAPVRFKYPPLPEQRRIAAILDKADALRFKRREALANLDLLAQSIFVEIFGDYREGSIKWPVKRLEEIVSDMKIGLVRSSEEFGLDFETPYVRMNAIGRNGEFYPNLVERTNVSQSEMDEYGLMAGDFLFNTRNSKELVGKTAIFRENGMYVYNNNIMRIRFIDSIDSEYVAAAFLTPFFQRELEIRKSGTTSVFAIYGRDLKSLPIPLPPLPLQQVYSGRVKAIEKVRTSYKKGLRELNSLFSSIQHRAFRGEL